MDSRRAGTSICGDEEGSGQDWGFGLTGKNVDFLFVMGYFGGQVGS